ncbi:MAG: UDP-N-acetylmuramate dehydrogenase [Patescibacteria group bacterium]
MQTERLEKELPGFKKNIALSDYTTFKIGGPAKYFYTAKNQEEFLKAISLAKELKLPFFVLGGGSNILVSDSGFNGIVIRNQCSNFNIKDNRILVEAGVRLETLVSISMENQLAGLEWGAGIPGTVGGAIRGNAGAFGEAIGDIVQEVEIFNLKTEAKEKLSKSDCQFFYKESIFKKDNNLIILSAQMEFLKNNPEEAEINKQKMINYSINRQKTQPLKFPSAGCVFKNPPDVSAGHLIDQCGLRGKTINNVQISEKHANFFINLGQGRAADVRELIEIAKKTVKDKLNIQLEEEIQYLGF